MTDRIRLAIVGLGKIARAEHVPALALSPDFVLAATADPAASLDGIASFADLETLLANAPEVDCVSLCTPPQGRADLARIALAAGKHVMLEKPPGTSVDELRALVEALPRRGPSLFAAWHSRAAAGVDPARVWLGGKRVRALRVAWKEDVRVWHPGQQWIWRAGGLGVFDPGINALSILTRILPGMLAVRSAALHFPENRDAPIAAELELALDGRPIGTAAFDFRRSETEQWDIDIETDAGRLRLARGGAALAIDTRPIAVGESAEYVRLYRRFAELVRDGASEVDLAPLALVADALRIGERHITGRFDY